MATTKPELLAGTAYGNETSKAIQACNDYLRLGPARSLRKLVQKYSKTKQNQAPTLSEGTLFEWSTNYSWQDRAADYDTQLEQAKNERRRKVVEAGLGLDFERVRKLKKLASFLESEIYETSDETDCQGEEHPFRNHKIWVKDIKIVGAGEEAYPHTIFRFNASLISEYRSTLDDLAKETGGRRPKEPGTADNPQYSVSMSLDDWRKQQAETENQIGETMAAFEGVDE